MKINELLISGANVTVAIGLNDLRIWHRETIEHTKKELQDEVLSAKLETYPTPQQVTQILNVSRSTLWRWHKKGYLVPLEIGGHRRYKMSEVNALLKGGMDHV